MKEFNIGTYNIRGLTDDVKKQNLFNDMSRYGVDICCLQETKIKKGCSIEKDKHNLICFATNEEAYGMGFVINKVWSERVYKTWKVDDRIAVLQLNPEMKIQKQYRRPVYTSRKMQKGIRLKLKIKNNRQLITIINCYAPHSELTKKNPKLTEKFYDKLDDLTRKYKNKSSLLIVAGDFNAEIGKSIDEKCVGRFPNGTRNENGNQLIEFSEKNDMILTNTCFDHKKCHLTTWSQEKINKNKQTVTHTRKTIDYILIENQYKNALRDSRTHQGTKTFSDHRLLVTCMTAQWYIIHRNKNNHLNVKSESKIDTNKLVYSREIQDKYQQKLAENMNNTNNKKWKNISKIIYETAKSELGTVQSKTKRRSNNNQIEQLSNKQKEIKIKIENSNNPKAKRKNEIRKK